jgi:sugar phosphate isomerase/epimerase
MKISVTSYSFSQLLRKGLITQLGMIKLAKEIGFDAIEFTDLVPEEGYTEEEYALKLKEESEKLGLPIISHTVGANLLSADIDAEIERLKHKIDIAALLGVDLLRHDAYFAFPEDGPKEFDYYLDTIADRFRIITEYAESKGIRTCTENHGFICQDAERVERIIKKVNHKNFGWLVDIGNFMCADADCYESVKIGSKYAFHVHAKDFYISTTENGGFKTRGGQCIKGAPVGKGVVPVKKSVEFFEKQCYNGYYTVEFEGSEDCVEALKEGMEYLKSCV